MTDDEYYEQVRTLEGLTSARADAMRPDEREAAARICEREAQKCLWKAEEWQQTVQILRDPGRGAPVTHAWMRPS
jgi:hypothetical protein